MIRKIIAVLYLLHGLVHSIGFIKGFNLGLAATPFKTTLGDNQRIFGALWIIVSALSVASAIMFVKKHEWFWIAGLVTLSLSQYLIIVYWQDAKWGTVINVLLLVTAVSSWGQWSFLHLVTNERSEMQAADKNSTITISHEDLVGLPPIVQKWLLNAGVVDKTVSGHARLRQRGMMRTKPDGAWLNFEAEQYFTFDPPAFHWLANIKMNPLIDIVGRDKFVDSKGSMLIKGGYILPMANSSGSEIDQGSVLRFMAELSWFPQAALQNYLQWEAIDGNQAKLTMSYGGKTTEGIFTFNGDGLPIAFEAKRFGDFNGQMRKETWYIESKTFRYFNGIIVGTQSDVTWKLKEGDFHWLKLEITAVDLQ